MSRINIFESLRDMPYFRNYQAVSGSVHNVSSHEDAVEDVLVTNGLASGNFKEAASKSGFSNAIVFRDVLLQGELIDSIPDNTYYSQPTGTHNSPDFIFKVEGQLYFLECKSGKGTAPMYNGGLPKENYIYHFVSQNNGATMYMGEDIVNEAQRKLITEFEEECAKKVQEFNEKLKELDTQKRGLQYYQRHMWQQAGGKEFTNYFTHETRELCESKVEQRFKTSQ